jgi:hypothetical protein
MSKIEDYRAKAEECRLKAAGALSQADQAQWLRLASDWHAMADTAEKSRIGGNRERP